jgi:hypothetical protein
MIVSIVVVITLIVAGMSIAMGAFSTLPGASNITEQPYDYIIFESPAGLTCAKNTQTNIIEYASSDAQYVLESVIAIVNATDNSGTIYIKAGTYHLDPTILPASASGYCLQGEFVGTNDNHTGTVFQANPSCAGTYMIDLNNSYHSNNIQLRDISFYDNNVAVSVLVDLSQSASACSRFTVRDCEFFAYASTAGILNFDNNEDAVIDHCVVSGDIDQIGLIYHTPGGYAKVFDSSLGGITYIGGMQLNMKGCVIGAGGLNITPTSSANNNIQLDGLWIESRDAYQPMIRNYAAGPATISIVGGRWNSENGQPFLNATVGPIYVSIMNLVINSNDGTRCDFFDNGSAADLICTNPSYNPLGVQSLVGCTAIYGAVFNSGHWIHTYGMVVIAGGATNYAFDNIPHGLFDTPEGILVSTNNSDSTHYTEVRVNWKNANYFSVILNGYTVNDTEVYWEAWCG